MTRRSFKGGKAVLRGATCLVAVFLFSLSAFTPCGCGGEERGGEEGGGVTPLEREIPLRTLAQGSVCEYGRFERQASGEETGPAFMVVEDAEELMRLLSLSGLQLPVGEVDLSRQVIIAALLGPRNTSGYAISVARAVQVGTEVRLEVEVVEPEPGSVTAPVLTSPYHLVVAERGDFEPRGELSMVFTDAGGEILERTSAEI